MFEAKLEQAIKEAAKMTILSELRKIQDVCDKHGLDWEDMIRNLNDGKKSEQPRYSGFQT